MEWIGRGIPGADAHWIGDLLGQLTPVQIRDAFRSGGFRRRGSGGLRLHYGEANRGTKSPVDSSDGCWILSSKAYSPSCEQSCSCVPLFDNSSILQNEDHVGFANGGEAMSHDN